MYTATQNAPAVRMPQNYLPEGRKSHYGLRLYKDDEVPDVKMEDTRHRWNILVFLSEVYAPDMGLKSSGFYIAPVFDFIDWLGQEDRFKGYLLSIPFDTWRLFDIYDLSLTFESSSFIPYVTLNKKEAKLLGLMMDILGSAIESDASPSNETEVIYLCRALMAAINRYYWSQEQTKRSSTGNLLVDKFLEMVEMNCLQEKKLDFYAKELKVTTKYLSHIVTHITGKNANKWIAGYVIDEVKRMLTSSLHPIQSISEKAGFNTSSDFCRYFRIHTGMTPLQYRRQNKTTRF